MSLNKIVSVIKEAKTILILPHIYADGDSLGSTFGLYLALKRMGKEVGVYIEEPVPFVYEFLPGAKEANVFNGENQGVDLVISLDTSDIERVGKRAQLFETAKTTVNIDHHYTNSEFGVHNYIESTASAVGEIIHTLIQMLGQKLDKDIATCLYVSIATDTGGFKFSNTTARTHEIVGDLVGHGADVSVISQRVFDSTTLGKVRLLGEAIQSLEIMENGKLSVITLTDEAIRRAGAKDEDCDGIVNTGRNIHGVEVAVLLRVRENGEIKVNFRSKNYVDVSVIAGMFGGGGHKRAAGCAVMGSLEDIRNKVIADIKEVL